MKKISFFLRDSNPQWQPYNQILSKIKYSYQIVYAFSYNISNIMLNNFNDYHELNYMNGIIKNYSCINHCLHSSVGRVLEEFLIIS